MLNTIQLKKNGFYVSKFNDNLKKPESVAIEKPFWYYYNHELILDQDIIFGDIFAQLEPYLDKLEEHFLAETRGWKMKDWFEEIKKDKIEEEIAFFEIRFNWYIDTFFYFNRKTNKTENSFEKYLSYSAMAKSTDRTNGEDKYSPSFIAIQNLRDIPVVFNRHCEISIWNAETKTNNTFFEFEEGITLRQLIACLFHETTFHGSPKTNQEDFKKLEKNIEEVDELNNAIEENYIPFSKIRLTWLKEELEETLANEDYKWAENVKKEMEKVKSEE